jgi:hypothetical protein
MMWLSWRQFRAQAIVAGCVLAAFAILLLATGLPLAHVYNTSGLPGCATRGNCDQGITTFADQIRASIYAMVFYIGIALMYGGPALMGAFWGAPLVAREIETGTFRLAWNQSVSRNRWLIVKVVMIGLAAIVVAGLLSLMLGWWAEPVYKATRFARPDSGLSFNRFSPLLFGTYGIAPIGYAAFAFALGLAAGVLIKRTVPAMAVTLGGFAFVQLAWPSWIRPHLISPARSTSPLRASEISGLMIGHNNRMTVYANVSKAGSWMFSNETVNSAGKPFAGQATHACLNGNMQACFKSIVALHPRELVIYQPASRFWAFQWYETGLFVVLALALACFCAWWISRRRLA